MDDNKENVPVDELPRVVVIRGEEVTYEDILNLDIPEEEI